MVERRARLLPIEIKKARQVGLSDIRHLELFMGDYEDKAPWAALLHDSESGVSASHKFIKYHCMV